LEAKFISSSGILAPLQGASLWVVGPRVLTGVLTLG
jgi:hypothetical protein